jgi:hemolysin D
MGQSEQAYGMMQIKKEIKISPQFIEFQPDNIEIEKTPVPGGARWTLYILLSFMAFLIIWSCIAQLDRMVIGQGKLVSVGDKIVVQPLDTVVIKKFHVKPGQEVKEGQILVTMDPTFTESDLEQIKKELQSLIPKAERIRKELEGSNFVCSENTEHCALQKNIYQKRMDEYSARIQSYEENIKEIKAMIHTIQTEKAQMEEQVIIAGELESLNNEILKKGAGSRVEALNAKNERIRIETLKDKLNNEVKEKNNGLERIYAEKTVFINNWYRIAAEELVTTQQEIEKLQKQMNKAVRLNELIELRSPKRAVVLEMINKSIGSVVERAEPVVTLIPLDDPLEGEVNINSRDIGFVRLKDTVRIKLEAFPFQKHGTISGAIKTISEDAFQQDTSEGKIVTYRSKITLTDTKLNNVPDDFRLIPGMAITAEIKVGKRRVISFFLYPVIRALDETMREP